MKRETITGKQIFEATMRKIAPLPSQEVYARNLAGLLSMHIHRNQLIDQGFSPDELPAPTAIVVAPTGQGKTYLIHKMTELLDLNVITVDGSSLVGEGYKGVSLSQILGDAMKAAKSKEAFERSVLFVDEVDKLRHYGTESNRFNGSSSLLQLFNNGKVEVDQNCGTKIPFVDVSRFAILLGGAFVGLEPIVHNRLFKKAQIGFQFVDNRNALSNSELLSVATLEDMAKYGMMPELLGRIGSVLSISPLKVEDYRQLLTADAGSLTAKYNNYLYGLYGVSFTVTDAGVEAVAARCMQASTGARAVNPLVNDLMREALSVVEEDPTIQRVVLDAHDGVCLVRYEHGRRNASLLANSICGKSSLVAQNPQAFPWHRVKANNEAAMVRKLCRYYRNAKGRADVIPMLEAFLGCVIPYLHRICRPQEFTLENLIKLAKTVEYPKHDGYKSPFYFIMSDAGYLSLPAYQALSYLCNIWTADTLVNALKTIWDYLCAMHGEKQVRFEVPRGK